MDEEERRLVKYVFAEFGFKSHPDSGLSPTTHFPVSILAFFVLVTVKILGAWLHVLMHGCWQMS